MVKRVFLIAAIALFLFTAFLPGLSSAQSQTGAFPSVWLTEDRYDFGTIGEGITVSHDFVFKNRGNAVLSLEPIQLS